MSQKITVNGQPREVGGLPIPYSDIVTWVHGPAAWQRTDLTITFRHAADDRSGSLLPGETVATRDGTVINVTNTGSA